MKKIATIETSGLAAKIDSLMLENELLKLKLWWELEARTQRSLNQQEWRRIFAHIFHAPSESEPMMSFPSVEPGGLALLPPALQPGSRLLQMSPRLHGITGAPLSFMPGNPSPFRLR